MSFASTSPPMAPQTTPENPAVGRVSVLPPSARTIIVGDVHGCLDELRDLLRACRRTAADRVILVGDLVAKGPDSQGVVQLAREESLLAVLGNHDAKVLSLGGAAVPPDAGKADHASPAGGRKHEAVARTLGAADWSYLNALPLCLPVPEHGVIVVHGGLVAGVPLEQQRRDLMLNMRSVTPDGSPSKRVEAGVPWASVWPGPAHVVFGHDAVRALQQHPFATGLDTGCVYGRALTALILPERRLVSVPAHRAYSEI